MRVVVALALLLTSCGVKEPSCNAFRPNQGGSFGARMGQPRGFGGQFIPNRSGAVDDVIVYDRDYRVSGTTALPVCSVATSCAMQCTVVGTTWTCVNGSGTPIAVTQGTGAIATTSPHGRAALDEVTDARAPILTGSLDAPLAAGWTIVTTAYGTTRSSATFLLNGIAATAGSFVQMRQEGNPLVGYANDFVATTNAPSSVAGPISGWTMNSWRSNAANTLFTLRTMSLQATDAVGTYTDPTGTTWRFGRNSGAGNALRGPLESVTVFSTELTSAQLESHENAWSGIPDDTDNPVVHSRVGPSWRVIGTRGTPYGYEMPTVTDDGLVIEPAGANNSPPASGWATDPTAAAAWTAIGTPTITSNVAAGPFAAWRVGFPDATGEADLIVDDDAATMEGALGVLGCGDAQTLAGDYTASCYVRSGTDGVTTDTVTIGVVTDGTGTTDCTFTGLTSTFTRHECYAAVTGTPTSIKGRIRVGADAAATGSVIVSQCQCEARAWATSPKPDNISEAEDEWTVPQSETATWPTGETNGGDVEVVFRPNFDFPSQASDFLMVIDGENADAAAEHWMFIAFEFVTKATAVRMRGALVPDSAIVSGSSDTDTNSTVPIADLVAGTQYVARYRYEKAPTIAAIPRVRTFIYLDTCPDADTCHATTLVGSDVTGTKFASSDVSRDTAFFGKRYNLNRSFQGTISRLTVKEIQ